jgi:mannose-6-phosphate isomerase-like protein (cupin superfamily)
MPTITTGRTLDQNGHPIDGTGFDYDSQDRLAELLDQRVSPIFSQPITGEWIFALNLSKDTHGEFERGVVIFRPGNSGPPEHIHPGYDEHFDIVQGEFIFKINGQERRAGAGEQLVVKKGTPHTFRCVGDRYGVVIGETRPAARIGEVISTLFGMAHEGALTPQGQPKLMQAMVIGSEYADDTVFTNPPPKIAIPVARALAPIGRLLGYRPTYPKYAQESWWNARVEQPGEARRANLETGRGQIGSVATGQAG